MKNKNKFTPLVKNFSLSIFHQYLHMLTYTFLLYIQIVNGVKNYHDNIVITLEYTIYDFLTTHKINLYIYFLPPPYSYSIDKNNKTDLNKTFT